MIYFFNTFKAETPGFVFFYLVRILLALVPLKPDAH